MFHPTRILCPTDFSPSAKAALDVAATLAARFEASIDVLHVWSPQVLVAFDAALVPSAEETTALVESLHAKLDGALAHVARPRRFLRRHLVQGAPAEEILSFAQRERSELVVMGTHGRTGLAHVVLGSVAERLVRKASVPVLTTHAA
jgi:nucleotide-binding universal stress UspA family protein